MERVRFYTGEYSTRQRMANNDGVVCYLEQHFNGNGLTAHGTEILIATNAGDKTKRVAPLLAKATAAAWGTSLRGDPVGGSGVKVVGPSGRGYGNIARSKAPSFLLESAFATNPDEAGLIRDTAKLHALAEAVVGVLNQEFPEGTIGVSIGHKGKPSHPTDRGVAVYGGGWEADYAEILLRHLDAYMEAGVSPEAPAAPKEPTVVHDDGEDMPLRIRMARCIVNLEAERDANGHMIVERIGGTDKGGTYQVAGINDRYHPRMARILADMIKRGEHESAETLATEYIAAQTDCARDWFPAGMADHYPAVEFMLRDSAWNRGPTGGAKILQHALGFTGKWVDGDCGVETKKRFANQLRITTLDGWKSEIAKSREWWERTAMNRTPAAPEWKGLHNRWNRYVPEMVYKYFAEEFE